MTAEKRNYEQRIVAFIDILGFSAAVVKSEDDEEEFNRILETLTTLRNFFIRQDHSTEMTAEAKEEFHMDTKVIQVSDSLIITRLLTERGGVYKMLTDCAWATHLLINQGFLCRGAIKIGNVYHSDTILFGTAYACAYEAESKEDNPIIGFEQPLLDLIYDYPGPANKGIEDWEYNFVTRHCKQLESGKYYLDYFNDYDTVVGAGEGAASEHYYNLRNIIVKGLELPKTSRAYQKNFWAAQQFNESADRFDLDYIPLEYP